MVGFTPKTPRPFANQSKVLISVSAIRTTKALRVDFLRHTLRQDIAFFESPDSPSVSGQVTTNGNLVNQGISEKLGLTIQSISTFFTAFIVAFAVQWKLTLIIFGVVPANLIVTAVCLVFDTVYEFKILGIYSTASSMAEEVFSSMRTVHAFCVYPRLSKHFEAILDDARRVGNKKSIIFAVLFSFEFFAIYSAYGLAFWQGVRLYARGEITEPGSIVT
jgi:ATP-binding cassette, subfamily B (MDR/TAP), member 1